MQIPMSAMSANHPEKSSCSAEGNIGKLGSIADALVSTSIERVALVSMSNAFRYEAADCQRSAVMDKTTVQAVQMFETVSSLKCALVSALDQRQ